jgi:hypothetical protein
MARRVQLLPARTAPTDLVDVIVDTQARKKNQVVKLCNHSNRTRATYSKRIPLN